MRRHDRIELAGFEAFYHRKSVGFRPERRVHLAIGEIRFVRISTAITDIELIEEERMSRRRREDLGAPITRVGYKFEASTRRDLINDQFRPRHFGEGEVSLEADPFGLNGQASKAKTSGKSTGIHRTCR